MCFKKKFVFGFTFQWKKTYPIIDWLSITINREDFFLTICGIGFTIQWNAFVWNECDGLKCNLSVKKTNLPV